MVPSSPISPGRRHPSVSSIDFASTSPTTFTTTSNGLYSPRTPRSSRPHSPVTPRQRNHGSIDRTLRYSADFTGDMGSRSADDSLLEHGVAGGLGSLADELAEAWGEDGDAEEEEGLSGLQEQGGEAEEPEVGEEDYRSYTESINSTPIHRRDGDRLYSGSTPSSLAPSPMKRQAERLRTMGGSNQRHRRNESSLYDGSEYGNDSDFEEPGNLPPSLEARMAGIEQFVRMSASESQDESSQVINRVIAGLRDLGGQGDVESSATRLITAHASLTSHLTHQTRSLQTLTHPLLFSHFPVLSLDAIEDLIPLIENILPNLPFPDPIHAHGASMQHQDAFEDRLIDSSPSTPLSSLQALLSQTSDLTYTLRALSDTLHESRQLTSAASRRLKFVRELVADMRREEEAREEGTRWIEKGDWNKRLEEREAGRVCRDVVSGFEAVCGEWRARLFGPDVAVA
ncbi:hypothetical protein FQN57_002032 [Myotisia sp. PD_48]|nr:hypothetical protein FQN57_002032 [Myotisia sp. PD_48]